MTKEHEKDFQEEMEYILDLAFKAQDKGIDPVAFLRDVEASLDRYIKEKTEIKDERVNYDNVKKAELLEKKA